MKRTELLVGDFCAKVCNSHFEEHMFDQVHVPRTSLSAQKEIYLDSSSTLHQSQKALEFRLGTM